MTSRPFGRFLVLKVLAVLSMTVLFSGAALAANPGLIEPAALSREQTKWVILDARPKSDWRAGRIPGAHSFSWEDYTRTDEKGIPYKLWPPGGLAGALGAMGIDEKTPLVVYGDADKSWGGEGWAVWVLSHLGHKGPVRLLYGGIQGWLAAKLPLKTGEERYTGRPASYRPALRPQLNVSTAELQRLMGKATLVDTRSTLEWFRGRIPTAVHIPWDDFFTGKDRRPVTAAELKKLLAKHGVDPRRPVVYYCTGGIRSGYVWMVHELAGLPQARNYEGGMEEWKRLGSL